MDVEHEAAQAASAGPTQGQEQQASQGQQAQQAEAENEEVDLDDFDTSVDGQQWLFQENAEKLAEVVNLVRQIEQG